MTKFNEKLIFHIDVNSAFLSWSAAKMIKQGEKTDLRAIAAVIGGDEQSRRGVVLAKSMIAKRSGIVTGESLFTARKKCVNLVVVSPDFRLYESCSKAMRKIFGDYTPLIEKFSIDECYLDVTSYNTSKEAALKLAYDIKDRIKKELGFTVNIGMSDVKLLAKMASDFEKPDKVHTLYKNEVEKKLWHLPVGELFMVGRRSVPRLNNLNIFTIGDLAKYDAQFLKYHFKSSGRMMWEYANGIDNREVRSDKRELKGINNSTTLANDIKSKDEAYIVLLELVEHTASRLRNIKKCCYSISVTIRNNEFIDYSRSTTLKSSTDQTQEILKTVRTLFDELWKGEPIRLLGVSLNNLCDDNFKQISIFDLDNTSDEKKRVIDKTIDSLRNKYGETAVMKSILLKKK
ncbi:DNA polymerase Y family protein [Clostridium estertheticum]|uniref:DNA polymerase Y family protein n=1 Tax=Clostridium estertheticum TaxID=238834 RepID=UPI001C0CF55C|nr:DNA polymerase IV [Clostridium estertheticum]MBU3073379.1 DNA polymerase IV [Clostridium estertheticum]MBU3163380.1 DNA polymerase IV [Clostridium estertheticum]MBU3171531.1 DNA polymerase IV [Clostridium estertheticum]MCB2339770.1 DNA polymerase IV [Clostridium estertheticum]